LVAGTVSAAREEILARIRAGTADVPAGEQPAWERQPEESRSPEKEELVALFIARLHDYGARVTVADAEGVGVAVADALGRHGARRFAAPAGLPLSWRPLALELVRDSPSLGNLELEEIGAALTGCAMAIAETGTIVLTGGPTEGRRVLTLLPDVHVCVVRRDDIVADVPDALAALAANRRPIVFVSGPSATSDIELERVEGVHGPRNVEVVVVDLPAGELR
jgi:L-lactate dehydrogenase complex protein LldG